MIERIVRVFDVIVVGFRTGEAFRVMRVARYSLISIVVGTVPLTLLSQGQDLLVSLADQHAVRHGFWFLVWLFVWAASTWYWSRALLEADSRGKPAPVYAMWARWLPRIAGWLTIFVPGIALVRSAARSHAPVPELYVLAVVCVVMSVLFLWAVHLRRVWIERQHLQPVSGFRLRHVPQRVRIAFGVSLFTSASLFVWFIFRPLSAGPAMGAVAILMIAAANTVFLGSTAAFLGRRVRLPVEILMLLFAALFSSWNDNHVIALQAEALHSRPQLGPEFSKWLAPLVASVPGGKPVPVVLVAAEGGGIRAAYWTASVLANLAHEQPAFASHFFAASTVSGGSVGTAVYSAAQRDIVDPQERYSAPSRVLSAGLLAPIVAKWVSGDLFQWFWPTPIHRFDRSTAFEDALADSYKNIAHASTLSEAFLTLRESDTTGRVPVLLLNSTSVDHGWRLVTSPVAWTPAGASPGAEAGDLRDFHNTVQGDVSLAVAVHNSSRFSYVSPAGLLITKDGRYADHVVDGGYFDNTGADTLSDFIQAIRREPDAARVRFTVLVIRSSLVTEPGGAISAVRPVRLGEAFAPLRAAWRAYDRRNDLARRRLKTLLTGEDDLIEMQLCDPSPVDGAPKPVADAPLGWQLSEPIRQWLTDAAKKCLAPQFARVAARLTP